MADVRSLSKIATNGLTRLLGWNEAAPGGYVTVGDIWAYIESLLPSTQNGDSGAIVGEIRLWSVASIPEGWLLCDGSEISRTSDLGLLLGDTYGPGDGSTTYNLPDFQGRFPIGAGATYSLGNPGGESETVLTKNHMPSHTHGIRGGGLAASGGGNVVLHGSYPIALNSTSSGGGLPHNNMPPYLGINYIIYEGQ